MSEKCLPSSRVEATLALNVENTGERKRKNQKRNMKRIPGGFKVEVSF